MTSAGNYSNEAAKFGMPTTIWVQLGSLKVAAVLSTSSWLSLMTCDIYTKLRDASEENLILKERLIDDKIIDGCGGIKEISKRVKLNVFIEEVIVPVKISVVSNLATDLVLGGEFITSVKGTFHFGLGAFKWQYDNKIKITNFITNPENLNIRSVDNTSSSKPSTSKSQTQSRASNEETCWGCEFQNAALLTMAVQEKLTQKASEKSKKTKSKNQSTSRTATKSQKNVKKPEDEFLGFLRYCFLSDKKPMKAKNNSASTSKSPKSNENESSCSSGIDEFKKIDKTLKSFENSIFPKDVDNWKRVYVMTKEWHDIFGGNPMVYNGIFWSKGDKYNLVFNEELEDKTTDGFHLIAVAKIIQIAKDNKLSGLRIISNNKMIPHLLNSYLLTGILGHRGDMPFFTKIDYKAYEFICKNLGVVSPVKFESADPTDESGLRKLERIIDTYVMDVSD